jgi:hypothetical protein
MFEQLPYVVQERSIISSHFVDASFFFPSNKKKRQMVLIPGDIDRDEAMATNFINWGFQVVRVTRADIAVPEGILIRRQVTWLELRELYRQAILTVLPMRAQHHIGGQTSLLESLACGTPVLTNSHKLENAFRGVRGVHSFKSLNKEIVDQAIRGNPSLEDIEDVRNRFGFEAVARQYGLIMGGFKSLA